MTESDQANRLEPRKDVQQIAKKPYVKPEFRHEKVFETMALNCGKIQSTQGQCAHNKKAS
jgi:hypothetical protein